MTYESMEAMNELLRKLGSEERAQFGMPVNAALVAACTAMLARIETLERKIENLSADRTSVADGPCPTP